jgi:hypothetical protein
MSLRLREAPWGAARFTYAYLGTLLAGVVTGLITIIAYPVVGATAVCQGSMHDYCVSAVVVVVAVVVLGAALFVVAHAMYLGWAWAAWFIVLVLVIAQIVVETDRLGWLWLLFLVPAAATGMTFERPDRDTTRLVKLARIATLVVIIIQFVIWCILLVMLPA